MSQSSQLPEVYIAFGFHVNTSHSYRVDAPDRRGFAQDIRVIRSILDTLDAANARGTPVCGVWDLEQLFSVEECLWVHAPELLERIQARVRDGKDEVIYMSYNNGLVSAMNRHELNTTLTRASSNSAGSGLHDLFDRVSPIVRPQEMMTSAGSFQCYREHGIDTVCMYYSATPFDAMRLFAGPLTTVQAHNPLRFNGENGASMRILPTYHTVDLIEHISLRHWVKELRRRQRSGQIDRDVLLFINFDADDRVWEGYDLPAPLRALPNTGGLAAMIASVDDLDYVRFSSLADYLEKHSDAGTLSFSQDTADGAWNGYASWSEKYSSQLFYSAVTDDRALAAAFEAIGHELPEQARMACESALQSSFECRLRLLSTTAYGLSTPFVAPGRECSCIALITRLYEAHRSVFDEVGNVLTELPAYTQHQKDEPQREVFVADIKNADESIVARLVSAGENTGVEKLGVVAHVPEELLEGIQSRTLHIECPFAPVGLKAQRAGQAFNDERVRIVLRSKSPRGGVSEGLSLIDRDGGLVLAFRGQTLLAADSFVPAIGYDGSRHAGHNVSISRDGSRGIVTVSGSLTVPGEVTPGRFQWNLFEIVLGDAPMVLLDGFVELPRTLCNMSDYAGEAGLERSWDTRWEEVEVCPLRLARVEYEDDRDASGTIVSRANEMGYRSSYTVNYHLDNTAHWHFASSNNHLSQPYVAVSVNGMGLAAGFDQGVRSSFAGIPVRATDPTSRHIPPGATRPGSVRTGRARVFDLNPFGTYYGPQWSPKSWGYGMGSRVILEAGEHVASSAPSYNGTRIALSLVLAPFAGTKPREGVDMALQHACRPATVFVSGSKLNELRTGVQQEQYSVICPIRSVQSSDIDTLQTAPSMSRQAKHRRRRKLPISLRTAGRIAIQSLLRRRLRFPGR